jgi:hypothetical protein
MVKSKENKMGVATEVVRGDKKLVQNFYLKA